MKLVWGAITDVGIVRSTNEDAYIADNVLFAVADGMGGHNAGEVASALAVASLRTASRTGISNSEEFRLIVQNTNTAIYTASLDDSTQRGMGTTLTAAAVVPGSNGNVLVANVGDSRTYLFRADRLERVTTDHSYVQELVNEGIISAEDARTHPRRNIVTRALGIDRHVNVDVISLQLSPGDRLVLCSDGLVDEVPDHHIADVLRQHSVAQEAAEALVMTANANGGRDNTTVVVVDVLEDSAEVTETSPSSSISGEIPRPVVDATTSGRRARRRIRWGPTLFWSCIAAIVIFIVAAIGVYARTGYFIGEDSTSQSVVVYRGRPGGILWFNPTVSSRTSLRMTELPPNVLLDVRNRRTFASELTAQQYLQLVAQAVTNSVTTTVPSTSVPITSTTVK